MTIASLSILGPQRAEAITEAEWGLVTDAFFGPVNVIADYVGYCLQSPSSSEHLLLAAWTIGAALGRQIETRMLHGVYRPNQWLLTLGGSGSGKSTRLGFADRLITETMPDRKLPNSASPESLLDLLQDLNDDQRASRRQAGTPAWEGTGAQVKDEFSAFASQVQNSRGYMSTAAEGLIEAYDGTKAMSVSTKSGGYIKIGQPCLSLLAATTESRFAQVVRPELFSSGFLARFLFQRLPERVRPPMQLATISSQEDWPRLKTSLVNLRTVLNGRTAPAKWPPETLNRLNVFAVFLDDQLASEPRADELRPSYERMVEQAVKLAMVLSYSQAIEDGALTDSGFPVTGPSLLTAITLVEESRTAVRAMVERLSDAPDLQEARRAIRWLEARGGEASNRDVLRNLHWTADQATKVRRTAEAHGLIDTGKSAWRVLPNEPSSPD